MFNMRRQKKQLAISLERWAFPRWGLVVLLLFGIGTGLSVYGQAGKQMKVSGTIVDENNEPLIGVTLIVMGIGRYGDESRWKLHDTGTGKRYIGSELHRLRESGNQSK